MGSSTFYRPPPGYWAAMNKLRRDREKSNSQEASPPPHTNAPPRDKTEGDERPKDWSKFVLPVLLMVLGLVLDSDEVKDFLQRREQTRKVDENESGPLQREDPLSQATSHSWDLVGEDSIDSETVSSQAQLEDT